VRKKERKEEESTIGKNVMSASATLVGHKKIETTAAKYNGLP